MDDFIPAEEWPDGHWPVQLYEFGGRNSSVCVCGERLGDPSRPLDDVSVPVAFQAHLRLIGDN